MKDDSDRDKRLADALRANLRRRKAQARTAEEKRPTPPPSPERGTPEL